MISIQQHLNFHNTARAVNVPAPISGGDVANKAYVDSVVEGLSWKTAVRFTATANMNISSPSAVAETGNPATTMVSGDRILLRLQTNQEENGIYVFNSATTPLVRSSDANTTDELEQALTTITEGSLAGYTFRQTAVNFKLDVDPITWVPFAAPIAYASLAEVNAGSEPAKVISPFTLANSQFVTRKFAATIGNNTDTYFDLTHNWNTNDVTVEIYSAMPPFDTVLAEVQRVTPDMVRVLFDFVPTTGAYRVLIRG